MRAALFFLLAAAAAARDTGSLTVSVLDQVTREPVKKAVIMVNGGPPPEPRPGQPPEPPQPRQARTDANGSATFQGLAPGMYHVQVHHPLYVDTRGRGMRWQQVNVSAGKAETAKFELLPGATVSGRVLDEDGDPVSGCSIQVRAPAAAGRPSPFVVQSDPSDENGEYRAFAIPPGRYYLIAQCGIPPLTPRPLTPMNIPWTPTEAYARQYYPNATSTSGASLVEVAGGAERSGADFRMMRVPVTTVRGVIRCPDEGCRKERVNIGLSRHNSIWGDEGGRGAGVNPQTGVFEFQMIEPGSYDITAYTWGNAGGKVYGGRTHIEVAGDRRTEPVVLDLVPAKELAGTVEFESGPPANSPQIQIQMFQAEPNGMPPPQVKMHEDGTFTMSGVLPGLWNVNVWSGSQAYVKSIWFGDTQAKGNRIDTSVASGPLRILMGTKTGSINGTVEGAARQVFLVNADEVEFMSHGVQGAGLRANGQFYFSNVAPGRYRIYAFEDDSDIGEVIRDPNAEATEVTVEEGASVTVTVKAVSKSST